MDDLACSAAVALALVEGMLLDHLDMPHGRGAHSFAAAQAGDIPLCVIRHFVRVFIDLYIGRFIPDVIHGGQIVRTGVLNPAPIADAIKVGMGLRARANFLFFGDRRSAIFADRLQCAVFGVSMRPRIDGRIGRGVIVGFIPFICIGMRAGVPAHGADAVCIEGVYLFGRAFDRGGGNHLFRKDLSAAPGIARAHGLLNGVARENVGIRALHGPIFFAGDGLGHGFLVLADELVRLRAGHIAANHATHSRGGQRKIKVMRRRPGDRLPVSLVIESLAAIDAHGVEVPLEDAGVVVDIRAGQLYDLVVLRIPDLGAVGMIALDDLACSAAVALALVEGMLLDHLDMPHGRGAHTVAAAQAGDIPLCVIRLFVRVFIDLYIGRFLPDVLRGGQIVRTGVLSPAHIADAAIIVGMGIRARANFLFFRDRRSAIFADRLQCAGFDVSMRPRIDGRIGRGVIVPIKPFICIGMQAGVPAICAYAVGKRMFVCRGMVELFAHAALKAALCALLPGRGIGVNYMLPIVKRNELTASILILERLHELVLTGDHFFV